MRKLIFFLFSVFLFSANLNLLLNKLEKNEDLSNITKQESGGISYVITRYQLDMMQAHYLRDILQNTIIGYNENRYNVLDPWSAPFMPYSSVGLRIFIDNQEIGSAKYDNGLYLFGNINLDFVDHIEIYYMTPNYKDGIEPSFVIFKLYTKSPKRDEGNKLSFLHSSTKSNTAVFEHAKYNKNFSYFTHLSRSSINHKEYPIHNKNISRDEKNFHFLSKFNYKNSHLLINLIHKNLNDFMGMSLDGAPDKSHTYVNEAHVGYIYKGNFIFKYNFDYTHNKSEFKESPTPLYYEKIPIYPYNEPIYNIIEKDYGIINTFSFNKYLKYDKYDGWLGVDFRDKRMNYPLIIKNDTKIKYDSIKKQRVFSFFTENRYQINKRNIISLAYKGTRYFNIDKKDYYLKNYKAGHTFVYNKDNIFKLFYYHFEYPVPLYFYSFLSDENIVLNPQKGNALILKYKKNINNDNKLQLIYFTGKTKNYPYFVKDKNIYNSYISLKMLNLRYKYIYNEINTFSMDLSKMFFSKKSPLRADIKVSILNTHRHGRIEMFENYIFRKTIYDSSVSVIRNLKAGIKYSINDNLTFSIKGDNLLTHGYTRHYPIYNYLTNKISEYQIELQERKIITGLEYVF